MTEGVLRIMESLIIRHTHYVATAPTRPTSHPPFASPLHPSRSACPIRAAFRPAICWSTPKRGQAQVTHDNMSMPRIHLNISREILNKYKFVTLAHAGTQFIDLTGLTPARA